MEADLEKQSLPVSTPVLSGASTSSPSNGDAVPKLSNCKFGWQDVCYSVDTKAGKKQILHNVNGCVEKGNRLLTIILRQARSSQSWDLQVVERPHSSIFCLDD